MATHPAEVKNLAEKEGQDDHDVDLADIANLTEEDMSHGGFPPEMIAAVKRLKIETEIRRELDAKQKEEDARRSQQEESEAKLYSEHFVLFTISMPRNAEAPRFSYKIGGGSGTRVSFALNPNQTGASKAPLTFMFPEVELKPVPSPGAHAYSQTQNRKLVPGGKSLD